MMDYWMEKSWRRTPKLQKQLEKNSNVKILEILKREIPVFIFGISKRILSSAEYFNEDAGQRL